MAPTKGTSRAAVATSQQATTTTTMNNLMAASRKGLSRRANANNCNNNNNIEANAENMQTCAKRKADNSPIKNEKIKRSALGNLTNNVKIMTLHPGTGSSGEDAKQQQQQLAKKTTAQKLQALTLLDANNLDNALNAFTAPAPAPSVQHKVMTRAASKADEAMGRCHKVLEKLEESLASRRRRAPTKKSAAPAPVAPVVSVPESVAAPLAPAAPAPAAASAPVPGASLPLPQMAHLAPPPVAVIKPVRRISNDFNKTEESLYMSALEEISNCGESMRLSGNFEAARRRSAKLQQKTEDPAAAAAATALSAVTADDDLAPAAPVPKNVEDFDRKNWDDPFQVSHYAMDIFNYLKSRESEFPIDDYMPRQVHLTPWMRTLLVDWMVEVQETFELNHETLYLAVKIVDLYLCREVINKEKLQLLGAAALFIACKFDERQPPLVEDFLYICDGAYNHGELVKMEMETLRIINYDLGIPLSYRFLRRYTRCAKVPMSTLTLARYILELSLMEYTTISYSDSQMAAAALFMALRMHGGIAELNEKVWSPTLVYYSGYELAEFADLVPILNAGLHRKPRSAIKTIRNKYSHKIFHEAAKVPLLTNAELFLNNLDLDLSESTITAPPVL